MRIPIVFADYPIGTLTGMLIVAGTIGAVLISLLGASAMSLTKNRRAARRWFIVAACCVIVCVISLIVVRALGLP